MNLLQQEGPYMTRKFPLLSSPIRIGNVTFRKRVGYEAGVIKGYPDGGFQPQGQASRAEVAAMIARVLGAAG